MSVFLIYNITDLFGEKVFEVIKYIDPEIHLDIFSNPNSISEELKQQTLAQNGITNFYDYNICYSGDLVND